MLGPVDIPSRQGYKFVLLHVDFATNWIKLVPMKGLTAKEACDALLRIWTRTGIQKILISDNGTLFKAGLTQELHFLGWKPDIRRPYTQKPMGGQNAWFKWSNICYIIWSKTPNNLETGRSVYPGWNSA